MNASTSLGAALSIQDLRLGYEGAGASHVVVQDLQLELAAGEIACLLGPSGCGKTTVLRAIAGFEPARAGEIRLGGQLLSSPSVHLPPERRRSVTARLPMRINSERGRTEYLLVGLVQGDDGLSAYPMGKGSGSVLAFLTFCMIISASSVRLMRLMSDGSDLLILAEPSRRDMMRAASGGMKGSGKVKTGASSDAKSLLNFCAMSRASSRCCF